MKNKHLFLVLIFSLFAVIELSAQYGYGGGGYGGNGRGGMYGRRRNTIPQAEIEEKAPDPKTADQIVNDEIPRIAEALELNVFESAVVSSILTKYLRQRIELQILKLEPEKIREAIEKIVKNQDEELKAGLPQDKYDAFKAFQEAGFKEDKKSKKKKKKKKKKDN